MVRQRVLCGLWLCGLWLLLVPGSGVAAGLPDALAQAVDRLGVDREQVSIWVQRVGEPEPLLAHQVDTARNPASVLKLVTSFAALEGLGPDYRWRTELYALGPVRDGVLEGDLLIRGGGDPFLVTEEFWKLTGALRRQGVREITGDLVYDLSYFNLYPEDPGAFDGRPHRAYNQPPHPLLVNFNAISFEIKPTTGGAPRVVADPPLPGLTLDNRLGLRQSGCGGFQRGIAFQVVEQPGGSLPGVLLEGRYPSHCDEWRLVRTVLPVEDYVHQLFTLLWGQWGGIFAGGWREGRGPAPGAEPVVVHESPPLGQLLRLVNKYSNNVMTRHLKLTLGAEHYGAPATSEKGRRSVLDVLHAHGIDTAGIVFDNGAGLSRDTRITARQVAQLLTVARERPWMAEFVSSLAIAGTDGTMGRRFQDGPERGRMHLKTGHLNDVAAIAGYLHPPGAEPLVAVVLVNHPDAHRGAGRGIQEAVLRWAFAQ
ncbi:D-alanyl-D-alanine carboxypeptidase/D-alanyl-D-alanine-endopeptidase [Alkalilimnicola ehrlichii MLHE-1]|uniref:D-alanyl-D-alanine carboxypeptidase/D-alanyl-D-alanine-endopeptidase n=1 Tax=Alkalilimnicola ehrlichii (strain ATCC BAA-1101 / DSM 17681 / MLHE-1) TaxID=187272 RepID=Q0A7Z9_ALKEH|nr:D-alanyl-D-alanine carboxypeptidase/D-alanyl-D-alanine-endopeptidase [Alkalilimnicola ehrlichii]ABI57038.1 D-alanyl-D-alanine carboxypeptidase/D-alanyl-D-alanine-endopeptidase [Alkalilimnicola ehrlichii MLHE-1]